MLEVKPNQNNVICTGDSDTTVKSLIQSQMQEAQLSQRGCGMLCPMPCHSRSLEMTPLSRACVSPY